MYVPSSEESFEQRVLQQTLSAEPYAAYGMQDEALDESFVCRKALYIPVVEGKRYAQCFHSFLMLH